MKRLWIFVLTLLLLCGCGKDAAEPSPEPQFLPPVVVEEAPPAPTETAEPTAQESHLAYEVLDLPCGLGNATAQCIVGDRLYTGGMWEDRAMLTWMDRQGQSGQLALPEGTEFLYALCPQGEGFTLLCGTSPAAYTDGFGNFVTPDAPKGQLYLASYDKDGVLLDTVALTGEYAGFEYTFKELLPTADGYLVLGPYFLLKLDRQGNETARLTPQGERNEELFQQAVWWEDGLWVLVTKGFPGESDAVLRRVDPDPMEAAEDLPLPPETQGLGLDGDGRLLLNLASEEGGMCAFDLMTQETTSVFTWRDMGAPILARTFFPLEAGYLFYEPDEAQLELVRTVPGPKPEPVVLTVANLGDGDMDSLARAYNRTQQDYFVEVTDYAAEGDHSYELLRTELMSGKAPDLFCFSFDGIGGMAHGADLPPSAVCADLMPRVEGDPVCSRDYFVPNLFDAMEEDGAIYCLPLDFSVITATAPTALIAEPGVSFAELEAVLSQAGEDFFPFQTWMTADNLLSWTAPYYISKFVDKDRGLCAFDSPEFADYLTWCKTWSGDGSTPPRDQKAVLTMDIVSAVEHETAYTEKSEAYVLGQTYAGMPVEEGVGNLFEVNRALGISAQCESPEGAWAFLTYCLDRVGEPQNQFHSCLPASMEAIRDQLQWLAGGTAVDWDGETLIYSPENGEKLLELLENTTLLAGQNQELYKIVTEEAEFFFAGAKTARETAALIQNRASLYFMEQYG